MTELEEMKLIAYERLRERAEQLRAAQRAYMKDRGNDEMGKRVAEAATKVDEVLDVLDRLLNQGF